MIESHKLHDAKSNISDDLEDCQFFISHKIIIKITSYHIDTCEHVLYDNCKLTFVTIHFYTYIFNNGS